MSLAAILAEQRRAAAAVMAEPGRGVRLWLADWVAEELLIMQEAMSETKTAGQVLWESLWAAPWILAGTGRKQEYESAAAAVIAWHEAQQWRPMSEQDEAPTQALLAYEYGGQRHVTECTIDWRFDDSQPHRYTGGDGEPTFIPGAIKALAWRHLPKPPEVPR